MQAIVIQGVGQCAHHVSLADQIGKAPRSPFARENLITHGITGRAGIRGTLYQKCPVLASAGGPENDGPQPPPPLSADSVTIRQRWFAHDRRGMPVDRRDNGWRIRPTTPSHPNRLLRLLPSGPDRVRSDSSQGGPAFTAIVGIAALPAAGLGRHGPGVLRQGGQATQALSTHGNGGEGGIRTLGTG